MLLKLAKGVLTKLTISFETWIRRNNRNPSLRRTEVNDDADAGDAVRRRSTCHGMKRVDVASLVKKTWLDIHLVVCMYAWI